MTDGKRPIITYRMGSCDAAIWRNVNDQDGQSVAHYSVTLQRRYRDKDGNWKDATSWYPGHLPQLILLLIRCTWWIASQEDSTPDNAVSAEA